MGVEVTDIVDCQWAQSIYFKDPNGLSLEYCCVVGNTLERDAMTQGAFTARRIGARQSDCHGSRQGKIASRRAQTLANIRPSPARTCGQGGWFLPD
jgi:hypothetical protein